MRIFEISVCRGELCVHVEILGLVFRREHLSDRCVHLVSWGTRGHARRAAVAAIFAAFAEGSDARWICGCVWHVIVAATIHVIAVVGVEAARRVGDGSGNEKRRLQFLLFEAADGAAVLLLLVRRGDRVVAVADDGAPRVEDGQEAEGDEAVDLDGSVLALRRGEVEVVEEDVDEGDRRDEEEDAHDGRDDARLRGELALDKAELVEGGEHDEDPTDGEEEVANEEEGRDLDLGESGDFVGIIVNGRTRFIVVVVVVVVIGVVFVFVHCC